MYEIYGSRVIFFFIPETSQALTIAISAFLAGLAFSSLIFPKISKNTENNLKIIFWMQIAAAIYSFFLLKNFVQIPNILDFFKNSGYSNQLLTLIKFCIMWAFLFMPAFFIGGAFPLINSLYLQAEKSPDKGVVYFWDTLGAIFGAFAAGFVFLPFLGFNTTALIGCFINLLIAFAISKHKTLKILSALLILVLVFYISFFNKTLPGLPSNNQKQTILNKYPELIQRFGQILFQENSPFGLVTVGQEKNNKALFINYRDMCKSQGHVSESALGKIAADILPIDSEVLNIGLGCGFTAAAIAGDKKVKNLIVAEINPVVIKAAKEFKTENHNLLENQKVKIINQDGAEFVRNSKQTFDAVIIDIEEPTITYSSPLYTKEYFAYIKRILKPGGILAVWIQLASPAYEKVLYNTLKSEFSEVTIKLPTGENEPKPAYFTFFASDEKKVFPEIQNDIENKIIKTVINYPLEEINTLDKPVLIKYFEINKVFELPSNYTEPFYSPDVAK